MFLSWLHKSWKYFWTIVFTILLVLLITTGALIGIMQTESAKNYLTGWIERNFSDAYPSELTIGELDGFIPFNVQMDDITVVYSADENNSPADTLVQVGRIDASIDIWSLLGNKISINGFAMEEPRVKFVPGQDKRYTLYQAFSRQDHSEKSAQGIAAINLANIEIIAPGVTVSEGRIDIEQVFSDAQNIHFPNPLRIKNINAKMFLELSDMQRFWDIESLSAQLVGVQAGDVQVSGQIYNDERYLEFNAFTFSAGDSEVKLNGEIDGVDLYRENLNEQLGQAYYDVEVSSDQFKFIDFTDLFENTPAISDPLEFSVKTTGLVDSLWVDDFSLGVGDSYFRVNGFLQNLSKKEQLDYRFKIAEVALTKRDVEIFSGPLDDRQFNVLENLHFNGTANGNEDSLNVDLSLDSPYGQVDLRGKTQLKRPFRYAASLSGKNVSLGDLIATEIDTTDLSFDVSASGMAVQLNDAVMELNASVYNSTVNGINIDHLELTSSLLSGFWEQQYVYRNGPQVVSGSSWIDLGRDEPPFSLKGSVNNLNLAQIVDDGTLPDSRLNFDYNIEMRGLVADRIQGRANIDVKPSVLGTDSLQSHQLYMDLDSPDKDVRTFRLTSSLFDLSMTGKIVPTNIIQHVNYWTAYARERIHEEILLEDFVSDSGSVPPKVAPLMLDGEFKAKNLLLLKRYWPEFPSVMTDTQLDFNVNADSTRLLVSAKVQADSLRYNQWDIADSDARLTASFRKDRTLKEFSNVDFETSISQMRTALINMDSLMLDLAFRQDSVQLVQKVGKFSNDAELDITLSSSLSDSVIHVSIQDFFLGNNQYAWLNEGTPSFRYNRRDEVHFDEFSFKNQNEYFELKGTMSPDRRDSLLYIVQDVNLERISELIDGRVRFSGKLNGNLITRSLTRSPSVQGELNVNRFMLQDRLVGDVSFTSAFNPSNERFDTQISVITDPKKYENYLESNDDIGQDIVLNGYFVPPDPDVPQDTIYDFDVNFNEIDMWVLPLIVKVFESVEGKASGQGYLRGNLDDFDFHADFQTSHVFAKPRFLETNYFLNGNVVLDRQDGVIIDSVDVTDTQGGRGLLWGTVDLNDFKPITFLDLSLRLDRLQFLNNDYNPDVPFYGTVAGTGLTRVTGANTDLFLRTVEPIIVTNDSQISIPLIEETELNKDNKFIQFVENFDVSKKRQLSLDEERVRGTTIDNNILSQAIDDLTFNERFNLDLQFSGPDNMNVDLIFDPVTGEILTANGTGQLRITMQDEEVQMFGRYNISGGNYQFVSGEIFTRRLELEEGGNISWQGDPENARLNISAVYRARPSLSSLTYQNTAGSLTDNSGQRLPIDLIVEINGTVSSVENNYYFRLPNSLDLSSNSTLSFTINQINRDEQQKLLQATSILLTGNFIPTQSYNQATSSLSQSLARGSTVLNPLLSNQVISPLLSNQMNALLNSDVSRFDIDFNLNAYNEIDLGIALRLYNDKLIFRREGQITGGGPDNTLGDRIGDLNATYQINKGLSVTAFHRQDQTLGNLTGNPQSGDITPSVDGVGLEARVQFNTWQDLGNRIRKTFNRFFGIKSDNELNKDVLTENQPN